VHARKTTIACAPPEDHTQGLQPQASQPQHWVIPKDYNHKLASLNTGSYPRKNRKWLRSAQLPSSNTTAPSTVPTVHSATCFRVHGYATDPPSTRIVSHIYPTYTG
jgi:hypothetical protein